ncbi:hypothetical protein BWQ96_05312 [Gracilariopsis chorda]|uniref:HTH CENPB-type domain-containing protein n=1 Tax=Gracilariopsis chorda TaxID=448386 RepID=A0A2V3IS46_9FLOR|nr:hypothetical protein BWQ96_05312 [Gracilariopsis chorda]|eukprot:PXF44948.1 hypothetical protein BWQ96_05312 [Gracilariopsis chorda]
MANKRITAPKQRADRQNYAKALSNLRSSSISIRKCALAHNLSYSSLQRLTQRQNHNTPTRGRGRKTIFTSEEEQLIKASVLSFSHCGTPLSRNCLKDLVQHYVRSLPQQRKTKLPFRNDRPGDGFVRNFIRRHPDLSLKRRSQLEKPRQLAMSPTNLAKHFARLKQVFKEYKITKPEQVFNIDESGFFNEDCIPIPRRSSI